MNDRQKRPAKKARRLEWAALAALLLFSAWAVEDSKLHLQLSCYELSFARLPAALDGLRIVQLSDLHGVVFGRDNRRLAELVRLQQPDLIALTGDLASDEKELPAVESLLEGLSGLAPVYYVHGNHEWAGHIIPQIDALMDRYGVIRLSNEYRSFEENGASLTVAGAEDPNGPADMIPPAALAAALRRAQPEDFILWLGHRNFWAEKYPELPVDLVLSGHAHGGIVRLPGIGGLLNVKHKFIADHEAGVYETGSYRMVVSRGLGNSVPVPRLFNRPEVVTVVLHSS